MPDLRKEYRVSIGIADNARQHTLTLWALDARDAVTQAMVLRWMPNDFESVIVEEVK